MSSRKALALEQKIKLIKDNQNGNGLSVRVLADKYGVSKSSVANILQRREEFISDYTSNCNKGIKRKYKDEDGHLKGLIEILQEDVDEEEEMSLAEKPPNLSDVLEMVAKLHLFASTQQPQLHSVVSDLQSQLTDIYIDSKSATQSSIKDYFSSC